MHSRNIKRKQKLGGVALSQTKILVRIKSLNILMSPFKNSFKHIKIKGNTHQLDWDQSTIKRHACILELFSYSLSLLKLGKLVKWSLISVRHMLKRFCSRAYLLSTTTCSSLARSIVPYVNKACINKCCSTLCALYTIRYRQKSIDS